MVDDGPCGIFVDNLNEKLRLEQAAHEAHLATLRDLFEAAEALLKCQQANQILMPGTPLFVKRERAVTQIRDTVRRSQAIQTTLTVACETLTREWP